MITQRFTLTLPEKHKKKNSPDLPVYAHANKFSAKFTLSIDKMEKKSWKLEARDLTSKRC